MSTFAILTPQDNNNYGNRLQNYALNTILSKYGEARTIKVLVPTGSLAGYIKSSIRGPIKQIKATLESPISKKERCKLGRMRSFNRFNCRIPYMTGRMSSYRGWEVEESKLPDYVVVGSDQVWNYSWLSNDDLALYLGRYVDGRSRLISYAASLGINHIDEEKALFFKNLISHFHKVSVREYQAAAEIERVAGISATTVLDPTLLLSQAEWESVFRGFSSSKDRYILTYFLGNITTELEELINDMARSRRCTVKRLLDLSDQETYCAGPDDFVELIANAEVILTDSYHACCFSLLFEKEFYVFDRAGIKSSGCMNSRMETLSSLLKVDTMINNSTDTYKINWTKTSILLKEHRKRSIEWIQSAIY